jgi:4-oxalocrotonate tautomerase
VVRGALVADAVFEEHIAAMFKRMAELLGRLHHESYLHVDEVRGDACGFGGLTQGRRYIAGKLEAAPQSAAT